MELEHRASPHPEHGFASRVCGHTRSEAGFPEQSKSATSPTRFQLHLLSPGSGSHHLLGWAAHELRPTLLRYRAEYWGNPHPGQWRLVRLARAAGQIGKAILGQLEHAELLHLAAQHWTDGGRRISRTAGHI